MDWEIVLLQEEEQLAGLLGLPRPVVLVLPALPEWMAHITRLFKTSVKVVEAELAEWVSTE